VSGLFVNLDRSRRGRFVRKTLGGASHGSFYRRGGPGMDALRFSVDKEYWEKE
jgi:hypothetical protein